MKCAKNIEWMLVFEVGWRFFGFSEPNAQWNNWRWRQVSPTTRLSRSLFGRLLRSTQPTKNEIHGQNARATAQYGRARRLGRPEVSKALGFATRNLFLNAFNLPNSCSYFTLFIISALPNLQRLFGRLIAQHKFLKTHRSLDTSAKNWDVGRRTQPVRN